MVICTASKVDLISCPVERSTAHRGLLLLKFVGQLFTESLDLEFVSFMQPPDPDYPPEYSNSFSEFVSKENDCDMREQKIAYFWQLLLIIILWAFLEINNCLQKTNLQLCNDVPLLTSEVFLILKRIGCFKEAILKDKRINLSFFSGL